MELRFFDFNKKQNSTKRPSGNYTSIAGSLKTNTSIYRPTFFISGNNTSLPVSRNFLYVPAFYRYYHVTDYRYSVDLGMWEYDCICDVLATYKDSILNSTAYILYSSSKYNTNLIDARLSNEATPSLMTGSGTIFSGQVDITGTYAINVISSDKGQGTATYLLTQDELGALIQVLSIETATELTDQMSQLFAGASINSILSCTWLPFKRPGLNSTVKLGTYDTNIQAYLVDIPRIYTSTEVNVPHPYNDFRGSPAYVSYSLFLPFYGLVAIDAHKLQGVNSLDINAVVDYTTGGCTYIVKGMGTTNRFIDVVTFNIGSNIPISSVSINPYGAIKSGANTAGSVFSLNFKGAAEEAFETFQNLAFPEQSVTGAYGDGRNNSGAYMVSGRLPAYSNVTYLWCYYHKFSDDPSDMAGNIGRPFYAVDRVGNHTGYVKCANFSSNAGTETECDEINRLLNGGVYIE